MMHRRTAKERDRGIDEIAKTAQHSDDYDALQAEFDTMPKVAERAEFTRKYNSLGVSTFVFLLVWFLGAMVFFFTKSWTYGTSLYFTYTSLTTIGYGDLVPQSNADKPFFVLWTLIAVPSVTILISNIGDTVVTLIQKGTMWLGQRTILPERSINNKKSPKKKGFWSIKNVEKAVNEENAREIEEGAVPDPSRNSKGIRGDIDKLGEAVETVEEERGHGDSMAAQLAREIRLVLKDLGKQPPRKYDWEDWKRWVGLLGNGPKGLDGLRSATTHSDPSEKGKSQPHNRHWIWLGDEGPLFTGENESSWILGKLCERLEQVLMEEVQSDKNNKNKEQ
ncbi:voltage-gated potassium channel [Gymnopus androsaceus JB14]|uniref:Voltage-gated potassium channel n=1 Tax=Gymnopus androsaceus JB14 TaxID=1447944 RepID=A0A6A4GH54_9AGAR|nr:voltage-gated potassium channel [Gymnopus androsaceus JB14]